MPGPKTHDIFYCQIKQLLLPETLSRYPHYDDYRLFAQGHDFLIYYDFYKLWKLNRNIAESVKLQEQSFQAFICEFLLTAKANGALEEEQTRLFIGPGYILHHVLDSYAHPLIIHYAGDHTRSKENATWKHGIIETLLDAYLMENMEGVDPKTHRAYEDFEFDGQALSSKLLQTLDESLYKVYGIVGGGQKFKKGIHQTGTFMRLMKYDPHGRKKWVFDLLDPIAKGTSSFSYHVNAKDAQPYLNMGRNAWANPADSSVCSNKSFLDLYEEALAEGAEIVNALERLYQQETLRREDICAIIPNKSSTSGLECISTQGGI